MLGYHRRSVRSTHVQPSWLRPLQEDHLDWLRPACGAGPRRGAAREPLHVPLIPASTPARPRAFDTKKMGRAQMKAVVVGGVAGGMSFAARARRLAEDAEIVVLERDPYVSYANCGLPYHLGGEIGDRDALLLHTPQSLAESLALDVRTGPEVLAIDPARRTVAVRELTAHADAAQLSARIAAGEWVADLRSRHVFAAGHVRGSQVAAAQRDLARIGIDHLAGAADGTPQEWAGGQPLASFPVASFADLAAVRHH